MVYATAREYTSSPRRGREKERKEEKECVGEREDGKEEEEEKGARVGVCWEGLLAKEERSRFIPRAFVNLPREHITAVWSSLQTEMRKVGAGWFRSFIVNMDVARCLIVSTMR